MKKKVLIVAMVLMAMSFVTRVWAYDFSYTYQGKTLYYNVQDGYAYVTYQSATTSQNYPGLSGTLVIPATVSNEGVTYTVKGISDMAFKGCSGVTGVTLPNTVTNIGWQSFGMCSGLTSFTIPAAVDTISYGAFGGASNLATLYFNADSCKMMGDGTNSPFSGCSNLTHIIIGNNVVKIPLSAFRNIASLQSVSFGNALQEIGYWAFGLCTNLDSVVIPASVTTILGNAFEGCTGLSYVVLPSTISRIEGRTFADCASLSSIAIPENVSYIGGNAFEDCTSLTSITIANGFIGGFAFYNCTSLSSVILGSGVTSIGGSAFSGCSALQSAVIGGGSISDYAFSGCSSLTSVTLESGVTAIGSYAFSDCELLTYVSIPSSVNSMGQSVFVADTVMMQGSTPPSAPYPIVPPENSVVMVPCGSGTSYRNSWSWTSWYAWSNIIKDPCETVNTLTLINQGGGYFTYLDSDGNQQFISDTTITEFLGTMNRTLLFASFVDESYAPDFTPQVVRVTVNGTEVNLSDIISFDQGQYVMYQYVITIDTTTVIEVWFGNLETPETYSVSFLSSDETLGEVEGYYDGETATAYAMAHGGSTFNGWSNGSMDNPLIITVTSDTTLTALFSAVGTATNDTILIHDTTYITLTDTVTNTVFDTITNTVYDTITNTVYDTTVVYSTDTLWLTHTDTIYITLHDTIIVHDTIVVGVDEVESINAKIYTGNGQIVVEGADGNSVALYDAVGRQLAVKRDEYSILRFDIPATGTYLVKVGNAPARRIVVVR